MHKLSRPAHLINRQCKSDTKLNNGQITKQAIGRSGTIVSETASYQELQRIKTRSIHLLIHKWPPSNFLSDKVFKEIDAIVLPSTAKCYLGKFECFWFNGYRK